MIGEPFIEGSWAIVLAWTVCGWLATIFAGGYMRRRLPFWV